MIQYPLKLNVHANVTSGVQKTWSSIASDSERAERLLQKSSESCMILNSVKTEITLEFKLTTKDS